MGHRLLLGCICALVAAFASCRTAQPRSKTSALWAGPDATRVVFDLSAPVEHRVFALQNPGSRRHRHLRRSASTPRARCLEGQGFVKQLRAGPQASGDLRFVLELTAPPRRAASLLTPHQQYGHRLVVDLTPTASQRARRSCAKSAPRRSRPRRRRRDRRRPRRRRSRCERQAAARARRTSCWRSRGALKEASIASPACARCSRATATTSSRIASAWSARAAQADFFISDSRRLVPRCSVAGASVYVLSESGATDEAARWLARRENASDLIGGVSLADKDSCSRGAARSVAERGMSASIDAAQNGHARAGSQSATSRAAAVQHAGSWC